MSEENDDYTAPTTEREFEDAAWLLDAVKELAQFAKTTGDITAIKAKVDELDILPASKSVYDGRVSGLVKRLWIWEELESDLAEVTPENFSAREGETIEQALGDVRDCIISDFFCDHPAIEAAKETVENYDDGYRADVIWTYNNSRV